MVGYLMSRQLFGRKATSIHRHMRCIFPRRLQFDFFQALAEVTVLDVTIIGNGGKMNHLFDLRFFLGWELDWNGIGKSNAPN